MFNNLMNQSEMPQNLGQIAANQKDESAKYIMQFPKNQLSGFANKMNQFCAYDHRTQVYDYAQQFTRTLLYRDFNADQKNPRVFVNRNYLHAHSAPLNPARRIIVPSMKTLEISLKKSLKCEYQPLIKAASSKNHLNLLNSFEIERLITQIKLT